MNQKGFAPLLLIVVGGLLAVAGVLYFAMRRTTPTAYQLAQQPQGTSTQPVETNPTSTRLAQPQPTSTQPAIGATRTQAAKTKSTSTQSVGRAPITSVVLPTSSEISWPDAIKLINQCQVKQLVMYETDYPGDAIITLKANGQEVHTPLGSPSPGDARKVLDDASSTCGPVPFQEKFVSGLPN